MDFSGDQTSLLKNQNLEFERNKERFQFLKWGSDAFDGLEIVPPGSGIVHQVNLEYLARVVFNKEPFHVDNSDAKVGCVFAIVVVSKLLDSEFGHNSYPEDASHFANTRRSS